MEHVKCADHDTHSIASVSAPEPTGYQKASLRGQLKERKRPGPLEKCFGTIKNTMHHSFNMVHHGVNMHVERGPGFD